MRNLLFLCCLTVALVYACQTDKEKVSPQGHPYTLHRDAGNSKANPGDYIFFDVVTRTADSVLNSSKDAGRPNIMQALPDTSTVEITAVQDIMQTLGKGDSITIPIQIDTIDNLPPNLQGVDYIYYDVVITDVMEQEAFEAKRAKEQQEMQERMQAAMARETEVLEFAESIREQYMSGALEGDIQTTDSGLKYLIHEAGTGEPAKVGEPAEVQYIGMLTDGTVFDQSFRRGRAITFPVGAGSVIQGWDEGIALLNEGAKATFFIPSDLGYGPQGSPPVIPADAELVFYVELEQVGIPQ